MKLLPLHAAIAAGLFFAAGCGDSGESPVFEDSQAGGASGGTSDGGDGGVSDVSLDADGDGAGGAGGSAGGGGGAGADGSAGSGGSGGTGGASDGGTSDGADATTGDAGCVPTTCQGHLYLCGNCVDDDGDHLADMDDPDCLGPCDNTEDSYFGGIPGQNNAPCKMDCYFDQDTGTGNDECYWDHRCDPHEVAPDYHPESANGAQCAYDPATNVAGTPSSCAELEQAQSQTCHESCGPLTPNGCDCFGCCELPAGSGSWVWLGSVDSSGTGTCDLAHVSDPSLCQPCKPVDSCLNTCEHCELCLGKTTLPADCFGDAGAPDGGSTDGGATDGGNADAGGADGSGGTDSGTDSGTDGGSCGGQLCPPGAQLCGLPCQAPCPTGYFCLTGCCQKAPQ